MFNNLPDNRVYMGPRSTHFLESTSHQRGLTAAAAALDHQKWKFDFLFTMVVQGYVEGINIRQHRV